MSVRCDGANALSAFGLSVLRRVSRTNWILPRFGVLVAFDENWVGEVDVVRVE